MRNRDLALLLVLACCVCAVACGRSGRGGGGFPQDSGAGNDASDRDAGNGGTDASLDASLDSAVVGDAATDGATDSGADGALAVTPPDVNCTAAAFNGHAYWFCTDNRDWDTARGLCMTIAGDLVSINDDAESAFVESNAPSGIWLIGLNKKNASGTSTAGTWEMVDGTTLTSYENWALGEPDNEDCGSMTGTGRWQDYACTTAANWICEVP